MCLVARLLNVPHVSLYEPEKRDMIFAARLKKRSTLSIAV